MTTTKSITSRRTGLKYGLSAVFLTLLQKTHAEDIASGSFMADLSSLKDSLVKISDEKTIGIGFITQLDGNTYVVTNANVVSGHNKLTFKTLSGKAVAPRKIELSATRDLARFLIAEGTPLKFVPPKEGSPVAALDYASSSKIKQMGGECEKVGKDMIEISAEFTTKSNGSPLLDDGLNICGAANYMSYYKMQGNQWEGIPRCFAYRLDNASWYSPNWNTYNRTYGKSLRDIDDFRNQLYSITSEWMQHPKQEIETELSLGLDFDRWVKQHNGMVSDLGKKKSKNDNGSANRAMANRFAKSCDILVHICEGKAKNLNFLLEDKKITPYLKIQFKWRSLELKKFGRHIEAHKKAHERDTWV